MSTTYQQFLANKQQLGGVGGFAPLWMPDCLFDFQHCSTCEAEQTHVQLSPVCYECQECGEIAADLTQ